MTREKAVNEYVIHALKNTWNEKVCAEAINALGKELCEDISDDGTLTVNVEDGNKVSRVLVCGDNHFGGLYYPEQEPCEDCISKHAVLDMKYTVEVEDMWHMTQKIEVVSVSNIKELPLVTPQPKTGHWEWVQYDSNPNIGN